MFLDKFGKLLRCLQNFCQRIGKPSGMRVNLDNLSRLRPLSGWNCLTQRMCLLRTPLTLDDSQRWSPNHCLVGWTLASLLHQTALQHPAAQWHLQLHSWLHHRPVAIEVLSERACFLLLLAEGGSYKTLLAEVLPMLFYVEYLCFCCHLSILFKIMNKFCSYKDPNANCHLPKKLHFLLHPSTFNFAALDQYVTHI